MKVYFSSLRHLCSNMNVIQVSNSKQWQYCIATQVLTIEELLHGAEVKMPPQFGTFKQAQKVDKQTEAEQPELGFG